METVKKTVVFYLLLVTSLTAQMERYTYKLIQSNAAYQIWTTLPSERVFKNSSVPTETDSIVKVYIAQNEFEPFQVVVKTTSSGSVPITMEDFGSGITAELYQVKYVNITTASDNLGKTGDYPDPLWPIENRENIDLIANENTAFWISVFVPVIVPAGDHIAHFVIDGIKIPIHLHVFDFVVSDTVHVKSQMNLSYQSILTKYGVSGTGSEFWMYINNIKQFLKDHRLTPQAVCWPGGLTTSGAQPFIDYDCNGNFTDNYGIWGFEIPAQWYLNGDTLRNDVGFPSFMAASFRNNDASADQRPDVFCDQIRSSSDWYTGNNPNSPYNQKWFQYISALRNYLNDLNYLEKSYYYFANEPQDQNDYDAIAWYSLYLKNAAPDLQLMVSENPRTEIFDHPNYQIDSQIDIWLTLLNQYNPIISHDREMNHGETTWLYFLNVTRPPFFNPITLDHPGIESKFTGWFLWKYRIKGLTYYSVNNWSLNPWTDPAVTNHNGESFLMYPPAEDNSNITYGSNNHRLVPSIRLELMRDSFEDYEYLYILSGNKHPEIYVTTLADSQANKIITSLSSYTRDSEFMYNLRRLIGQKNANEISAIPDIYPSLTHPRANGPPGNYYLNFQDPNGEPLEDPLTVGEKQYMKIGWMFYNPDSGYGWYGDMTNAVYKYLAYGPNELQKSIIYDELGKQKSFEFDLPAGDYNVTVSVGWQGREDNHHFIEVEGIIFIDDEATSHPDLPYIVKTKQITIADRKLTLNMGIDGEYTMLNYLDIEAVPTSIGLETVEKLPTEIRLSQNFPNPFNPATTIEFDLPKTSDVTLKIFNILGEEVATLVSDKLTAGNHKYEWSQSAGMASGIYLYRLSIKSLTGEAGEFFETRKMVLLR